MLCSQQATGQGAEGKLVLSSWSWQTQSCLREDRDDNTHRKDFGEGDQKVGTGMASWSLGLGV